MPDDPNQIADHLVQKHGLEGAVNAAIEATATAYRENDNYGLSVWREVKVILRDRQDGEK